MAVSSDNTHANGSNDLFNSSSAFLFPGQGAQAIGMAADLCEASGRAREVFRRGGEILGFDVLAICSDGPAEELNATRVLG